jgi:hypothetical protein
MSVSPLMRSMAGRVPSLIGPAQLPNHVAQAVKAGGPAGRYTVTWRVVSSDSHPIEGRFTFTVTGTAGASPSPTSPVSAPPAGEPSAAADVPRALVAGGSLTTVPVAALTRFRLSFPVLTGLIGAEQLWLHWAFNALSDGAPPTVPRHCWQATPNTQQQRPTRH